MKVTTSSPKVRPWGISWNGPRWSRVRKILFSSVKYFRRWVSPLGWYHVWWRESSPGWWHEITRWRDHEWSLGSWVIRRCKWRFGWWNYSDGRISWVRVFVLHFLHLLYDEYLFHLPLFVCGLLGFGFSHCPFIFIMGTPSSHFVTLEDSLQCTWPESKNDGTLVQYTVFKNMQILLKKMRHFNSHCKISRRTWSYVYKLKKNCICCACILMLCLAF